MGKNKKSAAAEAAAQKAPEVLEEKKAEITKPQTEEVKTVLMPQSKVDKLSQDSKVQYMAILQERYVRNNEGVTDTMRKGMNMIIDSMAVDVAVTEMVVRGNPVAFIVQNDPERYKALQEMGLEMGVRLPDFTALPAPTPQQLEQAGLSGTEGKAKLLTVVKSNISKETLEKKKNEVEAQKKNIPLDPTKIKSQEELKTALEACLSDSNGNPAHRMKKAIQFYGSYLMIQAGEDEDAKKKVQETSRADLLKEITEIIGESPVGLVGFSKMLNDTTNKTKSPVSAFCFVKRIFESISPKETYEDSFIADVVKTLITWTCKTKLAEYERLAERNRKMIETYEKAKNTEKAKIEKSALSANEAQIVGINGIIEFVNNPTFDTIQNLKANYDADQSTSNYESAHRIVNNIISTFYDKNAKPSDYDKETMLDVVTRRAGMITNLFVDPLNQSIEYKDCEIPELKKIEKKD